MGIRIVVLSVVIAGLAGARATAARAGTTSVTYWYGGDFDLPIPADPGATRGFMADAFIEVPLHLTIADLDVVVNITHGNVFDLQLILESPSGTAIVLNQSDPFEHFYHGTAYLDTIFDDEASTAIEDGVPPFAGSYRPLTPYVLSAFDGEDACGLWKLRVYDAYDLDIGTLHSCRLAISPAAVAPVHVPAPAAFGLLLQGLILAGCAVRIRS